MDHTFPQDEWLETDGLGGFASGTVDGIRTRRYHALLLSAQNPPSGRKVLVNGMEAWLESPAGLHFLSSQRYADGTIHPWGYLLLSSFTLEPWPTWTFRIGESLWIRQELAMVHGEPAVVLRWTVEGHLPPDCRLKVRLLCSGRDFHSLHHENPAFNFLPERLPQGWSWQFYPGLSSLNAVANAAYRHDPCWYRNFSYTEERDRGLDHLEDLASPGILEFDLDRPACLVLSSLSNSETGRQEAESLAQDCFQREAIRRRAFASPLHRAADAYVAERGRGKTIIAGYPWFGDWGRDTFIALRGLCLAAGRLQEAHDILIEWADAVSEGMLPNRFPDSGEQPEYNSVDASLWYIIAVEDFLDRCSRARREDLARSEEKFRGAVEAILQGYSQGTRHGIRLDDCGLLASGEPGVQLTWMDAKVGDWVVTPRTGKPVEVQALWLNALAIASRWDSRWKTLFDFGLRSFQARFWNESRQGLFDVIDCFHHRGTVDVSLRPNQIFAVGGLPRVLLPPSQARAVVETVEKHLWTSMGLRSLAPEEMNYVPRYEGGVLQRDGSYHQGTVWPWLAGPFIEAWVRVHGGTPEAKAKAADKFLRPLLDHLDQAGLGHISEIADADPPHLPRGCPFQAWSLGEIIRIRELLNESSL